MLRQSTRTKDLVIASGVAGKIDSHTGKVNVQAIAEMLAGNPYFDLGIKVISERAKKGLTQDQAEIWVAEALGITTKRFKKSGPGYIDPSATINQIELMLQTIDQAIIDDRNILLATAHPGSLLQFYVRLAHYILERQEGPLLVCPDKSWQIAEGQWIDTIESVMVISDFGALIHTHDHQPMDSVLKQLMGSVDLVVADHGLAGAAINAGIQTIGIHDVDDPAIPVAARLGANVIPVPMNDNQRNIRTDLALEAVMRAR